MKPDLLPVVRPVCRRSLLCRTCALLLALAIVGNSQAEDQAPRQEALKAIRQAAGNRDLKALETRLAAAKKLAGEEKYDQELQRLEDLASYLTQFWMAVDTAGRKLQALGSGELTIGEQICAFVEYDGQKLVLRVAGQNRTYTKATLPAKVALALAEQEMDPKVESNKVFTGAFLAMDGRGDRKLARQMWQDAQRAGTDVRHLLPELETDPPAPPVDIPELTQRARLQLHPKNWTLRTKKDKRWVKKPLGDAAEQNEEGRLVITAPAGSGEAVQFLLGRQVGPNFVFKITLEGVQKGQQFGLFALDGDDEGYAVELPAGVVVAEISRQGGELRCRVHGKDAELETIGKPSPRMPGLLGITIPADATTTIAGIEFGVP